MTRTVAPALRALVTRLIDYAGTFPPAAVLSVRAAAENFADVPPGRRTRGCSGGWWSAAADLDRVPAEFDGALSVLADVDAPRAAGD